MQVYLITELLTGGELLDAVLERGSYSEADARLCFAQLLSGIDYLHSRCGLAAAQDPCHDGCSGSLCLLDEAGWGSTMPAVSVSQCTEGCSEELAWVPCL